jgi:hypothetical protein
MSIKFITALLASMLVSSCYLTSKDNDCGMFRTGKFRFYGKESKWEYIIERNDSVQIERNLTNGHITKTRIKWTGDCEYQLTYLGENDATYQNPEIMKSKALKTKILQVTKDYCIFETTMDGSDRVLTDTFWVYKSN